MVSTTSSAPATHRILQLDGLRAVAIIAVFLHHAFNLKLLWMGVDLFFVLSGFLITGILMAQRGHGLGRYFGRFYQRRAKRIYPPYLLLLLLTTFVFSASWLRHAYLYLFLMNFIMPFGIAQPDTLSVLWSLAVEEQFYLLWPFAVYFIARKRLAGAAVSLIVAAPLFRWLCTPLFSTHWWIYFLTPFRMDCLAMGALIAVLRSSHRALIDRAGRYGLPLAGGALLTLAGLSRIHGFTTTANTRAGNVLIYELCLTISAGLLLWALAGRGVGLLTLAPLRYIGRISYSIYLIHPAALALARAHLHSAWTSAFAATLATVAYAALSWRFLEEPLLGRRPAESSANTAPTLRTKKDSPVALDEPA